MQTAVAKEDLSASIFLNEVSEILNAILCDAEPGLRGRRAEEDGLRKAPNSDNDALVNAFVKTSVKYAKRGWTSAQIEEQMKVLFGRVLVQYESNWSRRVGDPQQLNALLFRPYLKSVAQAANVIDERDSSAVSDDAPMEVRESPRVANPGATIDRLRKECGLTFEELADETGIDERTIRRHVKGGGMRLSTRELYAQAFTKKLSRPVTITDLQSRPLSA